MLIILSLQVLTEINILFNNEKKKNKYYEKKLTFTYSSKNTLIRPNIISDKKLLKSLNF